MVSIYIIYMIPFFVNLLTCWHFDSNQPKKKFSLVVIREAVVHALLPLAWYYCTSYSLQVRQRYLGVTLILYQPIDNNKCHASLLWWRHTIRTRFCLTQPALTSSQVVQAITTSKRYCVVTELDTKYNLMSSHTDKLLVSFVLLVPSSNYAAIGEHAG